MITIKAYAITALLACLLVVGSWNHGHHVGWRDGQADLAQQYKAKAQQQLSKSTTTIQAGETKAAAAKNDSDKQFEVITRETIKYVTRPNPDKHHFDADRVRIKQSALDAAGSIPGYDDEPGQTDASKRGP